ncbi:hypothetical protein KBY24_14645 [Ruegeria pomeroyi]|nr:hypothetical protein [Ruegeria pomeroyi]MCE8534629.1 hypothetical protein [Ruegeria pomeroyi]
MSEQHKSYSFRRLGLIVSVFMIATVAVLLGGITVSDSQAQSLRSLPEEKFTGGGPEVCLACHGGPEMTIVSETPHGDLSNPHSPYAQEGCESCHGPGSLHVSSARGGVGFPALNDFKHVGRPAEGQFDTCLSCHAETSEDRTSIGWVGSRHEAIGMSCTSCHEVHAAENALANVEQQRAQCSACHGLSNPKHEVFENAGMQLDAMKCTQCHDPHK